MLKKALHLKQYSIFSISWGDRTVSLKPPYPKYPNSGHRGRLCALRGRFRQGLPRKSAPETGARRLCIIYASAATPIMHWFWAFLFFGAQFETQM